MQIGNFVILPWNRKNFIPRLVVIGLALSWLVWGLIIWQEQQRLQSHVRERQEQQLRREEQQRREAAYQRRMIEEQRMRSGVQNAVDGFKR